MTGITDNRERSRYEMAVDGEIAFVAYQRGEGVIRLNHAEVPRALEGRGIGGRLVKATLDAIRAEEPAMKVVPRCSFIAAFIRRNAAEYGEMVA